MAVNLNSNIVNSSAAMGVIPTAPSRKCRQMSFQGEKPDSFSGGEKKESFLYRYRGIMGFLAASFVGEAVFVKSILPHMKKPSGAGRFFAEMGVGCAFGLVGQAAAEILGRKKTDH